MSGFSNATDGNFDRVFMTSTEIVDRYVGTTLWGWGYNTFGQVGNSAVVSKSTPIVVIGSTNWTFVTAGAQHSLGVKQDGTLWMWGYNGVGQLGDNSTTDKSSPVQTVTGGTNWRLAAGGDFHTAAVKTDGTLWCWGWNTSGQLGDNSGTNKSSPVQTIAGGTNWRDVACGPNHTAAIKTDGTLWVWGNNGNGQLGDNTISGRASPVQTVAAGTNWKYVACGAGTTAAIKTDGTLWMCGYNTYGQLGNNTTVHRSSPVQTTAGGTNWKSVSCGEYHTVAIKTDGTLWAWGYSTDGQLGTGNTNLYSNPVQTVAGGTNWKQLGTHYRHTAAIKTDGTLWMCGSNNNGQLGTNNTTSSLVFVNPTNSTGTSWKQVFCGQYHTIAIGE